MAAAVSSCRSGSLWNSRAMFWGWQSAVAHGFTQQPHPLSWQEKSKAIPFLNAAPALDGTMPGDKGFDPLLLSNTVPLKWAREVGSPPLLTGCCGWPRRPGLTRVRLPAGGVEARSRVHAGRRRLCVGRPWLPCAICAGGAADRWIVQ